MMCRVVLWHIGRANKVCICGRLWFLKLTKCVIVQQLMLVDSIDA
jgi:hypothetical protein